MSSQGTGINEAKYYRLHITALISLICALYLSGLPRRSPMANGTIQAGRGRRFPNCTRTKKLSPQLLHEKVQISCQRCSLSRSSAKMTQWVSDGRKDKCPRLCYRIPPKVILISSFQSTACRIELNNNTSYGATYVWSLQNIFFFTMRASREGGKEETKPSLLFQPETQWIRGHKTNSWLALRHCISGSQCANKEYHRQTCKQVHSTLSNIMPSFPCLCYPTA